ncbi:MAG: TIGR00159 family protein [Syntrophomonadaceae bacterium]|nr:TIGR00159 family protein [Syntrophomonadaceae bacterium]
MINLGHGGRLLDFTFLSGVFASPWNIVRSLIDISIVAYIFYRILRLIKGTRAEQLLKGLGLLLVFSVAASFLKLDMINWLMEKLWILFAIAIPIVFQPEMRRLLEQIGRGSFFTRWTVTMQMEEYENVVREICDAVAVLSRNKIGALLVLTRETGIAEYAESGVQLDALVSSSLLVNIFMPNSPLHDGAVVISGGRIDRAACFLPLTDSPYLDKDLGTRHRAGLGITEVSDAVAVIVSEETGAVSLAKDGNLQRYLDAESLKDILEEEMARNAKWGSSLWRRWADEFREKGSAKDDRA